MTMNNDQLATALGSLGYPGLSHLQSSEPVDPAAVLLDAIDRDGLDPRVREGLPWIPRAFPDLNWDWLIAEAQHRNLQNRLGFIVALAALSCHYLAVHYKLMAITERLAEIRRNEWDTLANQSMTKAERAFVHSLRYPIAERWHIDSDLELTVHATPRVGESFEVRVDRWQIMPPREVCGHLRIRTGDLVRLALTEDGVLMTSEYFRRPEKAQDEE
jgi:hypothetical protein